MKTCNECKKHQVYAHGLCEKCVGDLFTKEVEPHEADRREEV